MTNLQLNYLQHRETMRHNKVGESLSRAQLGETIRSNKTREAETERSNRADEAEKFRSATANEELMRQKLNEEIRAHLASEGLTRRQLDELERNNKYRNALDTISLALKTIDTQIGNAQDGMNTGINIIKALFE